MDIRGKTFLVTGGAGLVGSHIVDDLVREGAKEVRVYDSLVRGKPEHLDWASANGNLSIVQSDIRDRDALAQAMKGVDAVFHEAALWLRQCQDRPRDGVDINIIGTFNVLEACVNAGVKRVVAASSSSVYGDASGRKSSV
jgi:UDP-glucose 4-epimerase